MTMPMGTEIGIEAIEDMAVGATFLGAGGGGDTYATLLQLKQLLRRVGPVRLIEADDLADDDYVAPCGWLGAPGIQKEKYPSGMEGAIGLRRLQEVLGASIRAIMPIEIGGQNGIAPFVIAAQTGVPVVNCDAMGRAFPKANMVTFNIYGCKATPAVASDTHGNCVVLDTEDNETLERFMRPLSVAMGGHCHLFDYPLRASDVKRFAVPGTIALAQAIGSSIRYARNSQRCPHEALMSYLGTTRDYSRAFQLFDGKIVDVERDFSGGFLVGRVVIGSSDRRDQLVIHFRNEYIYACLNDRVIASVPDIIAVLDRDTATAINTENLKYGQRVTVVSTSVGELLRSREALRLLGPEAFDLPFEYRTVEDLNRVGTVSTHLRDEQANNRKINQMPQ